MEFYRYEIREYASVDMDGYPIRSTPKMKLYTFELIKETPKGYWIGLWGFASDTCWKKWIPKKSLRRYAYPTKEEALNNYIRRTEKRIKILERQVDCCKIGIEKAKCLKNE